MMDQAAKAKFILQLHKHSLQAFDSGGTVLPQTTTMGPMASPTDNTTAGGVFGKTADPTGFLGNTTAGITNNAGQIAQGFSSAFTPQNQFQAETANTANTDYGSTIGQSATNALAGYGQAQNIQQQQEHLAGQLGQEAAGGGPDPAGAALAAQTGQNVSQQASLAAGQRGASGNVGLMARQNAQAGAGIQQAAVGQAATLKAQQQLSAQQQLQQQQQNISGGNIAEQGVNANLFGSAAGAQNAQNNTAVTNLNNAQTINAATAQNNTNATQKTESGLLGGVSSLAALLAKGGMVKRYADGGDVPSTGRNITGNTTGTFSGMKMPSLPGGGGDSGGGGGGSPQTLAGGPMDNSGSAPSMGGAMLAAGGGDVMSHIGKLLKHGKFSPQLAAKGGTVNVTGPGQKAVAKGDSYKNDKVPALLSEGEIVIDKNTLNQKDPVKAAADFVRKTLAQRQAKTGMRA